MDDEDSNEGLQTLASQFDLDAHQTAPQLLKEFFKSLSAKDGELSSDIIDFIGVDLPGLESIPDAHITKAFGAFPMPEYASAEWEGLGASMEAKTSAFGFKQIPGLVMIPSLVPERIQVRLLSRLLCRDLSNPQHQTNLHLHYNVSYPDDRDSLFSLKPHDVAFEPKDPSKHKPLNMKQVLEKKLRWMTLGGQYDWTKKLYPSEQTPGFPPDIRNFINSLFPDMDSQAAIVNLYSPGNTLSLHRDVSEEVDRGLVSISLGCDCIFVIGLEHKSTNHVMKVAIRLKSGDALYMKGESRLAWHGVPKIIPNTCPEYLWLWPGESHPDWQGWMKNKRINLNVRQIYEKGPRKAVFETIQKTMLKNANEIKDSAASTA